MDAQGVLAALAIVVSLASLAVAIWSYKRAAVTARKPVLLFEYAEQGWTLTNVGMAQR